VSKRIIGLLSAAFVLAFVLSGLAASPASADDETVLKFETMAGNLRPYVGGPGAIRGLAAGGRPWVIGSAEGKLEADGKFELAVYGVVFDPNDASNISAGVAGRNTVPSFGAVISCQTVVDGAPAVRNVNVGPVPATQGLASDGGGNAYFEAKVDLPKPCYAPIVFVTNPGFTGWFATTGFHGYSDAGHDDDDKDDHEDDDKDDDKDD
jgi:hypothetical protein